MKRRIVLGLAGLCVALAGLAQYPSRKVAEFTDSRACRYYLVRHPESDSEEDWMLQKVSLNGKSVTNINNPYASEEYEYGCVKDAKLVGDNLYVINTTYRQGDNVACLNTRTGRWTNPVPECAQAEFIAGNKMKVMYSKLVSSGSCTADNRYTFSEKIIQLK